MTHPITVLADCPCAGGTWPRSWCGRIGGALQYLCVFNALWAGCIRHLLDDGRAPLLTERALDRCVRGPAGDGLPAVHSDSDMLVKFCDISVALGLCSFTTLWSGCESRRSEDGRRSEIQAAGLMGCDYHRIARYGSTAGSVPWAHNYRVRDLLFGTPPFTSSR